MNIVSIKYNIIHVLNNLVTFYKLSKPRLLLVHTSLMSILDIRPLCVFVPQLAIVEVNTRTKVLCPFLSINWLFPSHI